MEIYGTLLLIFFPFPFLAEVFITNSELQNMQLMIFLQVPLHSIICALFIKWRFFLARIWVLHFYIVTPSIMESDFY